MLRVLTALDAMTPLAKETIALSKAVMAQLSDYQTEVKKWEEALVEAEPEIQKFIEANNRMQQAKQIKDEIDGKIFTRKSELREQGKNQDDDIALKNLLQKQEKEEKALEPLLKEVNEIQATIKPEAITAYEKIQDTKEKLAKFEKHQSRMNPHARVAIRICSSHFLDQRKMYNESEAKGMPLTVEYVRTEWLPALQAEQNAILARKKNIETCVKKARSEVLFLIRDVYKESKEFSNESKLEKTVAGQSSSVHIRQHLGLTPEAHSSLEESFNDNESTENKISDRQSHVRKSTVIQPNTIEEKQEEPDAENVSQLKPK
ncbi:MAG: hypothetical protein SFW66_09780 [Gammaproteobacteria bacterium]|nr:hypothetical protein [Gammaproteobacteria bacterium]